MIEIAPSVLAADVLRMGQDVQRILDAGADLLHIDIMDAHFVPNLSYGPAVVKALRGGFAKAVLDVHLMMDNPQDYVKPFIDAGANEITVHVEIKADIADTLAQIRQLGARCGLSLRPGTPAEALLPYLDLCDLILIMTVEPGFGGQKMMPQALEKAAFLRSRGFGGIISADGGLSPDNAAQAIARGVNRLVMGTALFGAPDPATAIARCRQAARP